MGLHWRKHLETLKHFKHSDKVIFFVEKCTFKEINESFRDTMCVIQSFLLHNLKDSVAHCG